MRKGISIVLSLVILFSVAHITVATHFCGGKVADTKVSLSGKLASCGMETAETKLPVAGTNLANHCCDNQVMTIGICNIFTTPLTFISDNIQNLQHVSYLPVNQLFGSVVANNIFFTSISPPGRLTTTSVDLNGICVFRI
jgi:hypothetical protein